MTDPGPIAVRFTERREFIDELERDRELVDRSIVRVTKVGRPNAAHPYLTSVHVEASAIVGGRLVELSRYTGELWGVGFDDAQVQHAAGEYMRELTKALQALELEVRAGLHVDEAAAA